MLKDFSLGTILYILISILFGREFDIYQYFLSLVLSILPDMDFIPYILLRKRLFLVTHRIIHYPLLFAGTGLTILMENHYFGTLFLVLATNHFVLDTFSTTEYPTGIQWLFPFSKKSWYIFQGKIYQLTAFQQSEQLSKRMFAWNTGKEKRTTLWEVMVRLDALTPITMILIGFAVTLLTFFSLRS